MALHDEYGSGGTIQRLPNELLAHIFVLYKNATFQRPRAHDWYRQESGRFSHQFHGEGTGWIPLLLVCRFWRDLALDTPSLWQSVDVYKSTRWLELALVRSRQAPLDLFFQNLDTARDAVPLILPHATRLRTLILPPLDQSKPGSSWMDTVHPDLAPFLPLLDTAMPALKELTLSVQSTDHTEQREHTKFNLDSNVLPSLRILRLACVSLPWSTSEISKLTTLDLRACVADNSSLTCDQFLDVLGDCKALEELRLLDLFVSSAIRTGELSNAGSRDSARVVHLPRLRLLVLADAPSVTSWLLAHLPLTGPKRSVIVIGWLPGEDLNAALLHGAFASVLPDLGFATRLFSGMKKPTEGDITIMSDESLLSVSSPDGTASLCVQLESRSHDEWDDYMPEALRDFRRLFSTLPISTLSTNGFYETVPSSDWLELLDALPQLETLSITGRGSPTPLFHALKHTQIHPALEDIGPIAPPCAELRRLQMEYPDYTDGDIELLVAVLHRRVHFGLARMESMELYLWTEDDEEAFDEEMELYLSELETLCPDIKY